MDITAFTRIRSPFECILFGYVDSIALVPVVQLGPQNELPNSSSFPLIIIAHTS